MMRTRRVARGMAGLGLVTLLAAHAAVGQPAQEAGKDAAAPAGQTAPWHTLAGPERGFSAEMPAPPAYAAIELSTGAGTPYTMHQYMLERDRVAYVAQTVTYPEDVKVSNPRANLQSGLDNVARSMEGGKWTSIGWLTHQGSTAVDAVGERDGHAIRSFSVMKGRQVFTLTYAGPAGSARSAEADRFVASLRIGP